jgi:hypothetical protein
MEFDSIDLSKCMPNKDFGCGFYTTLLEEQAWRMAERRARIAGGIPVANDTVGLLIRQFSRGTIDAEYLKKQFDFGQLTNQYTFHTEKALKYLKKVGVMHDKPAAGND